MMASIRPNISSLLLLLLLTPLWAEANDSSCEKTLSPLREVRARLENAIGPERDPFRRQYTSEKMSRTWTQLLSAFPTLNEAISLERRVYFGREAPGSPEVQQKEREVLNAASSALGNPKKNLSATQAIIEALLRLERIEEKRKEQERKSGGNSNSDQGKKKETPKEKDGKSGQGKSPSNSETGGSLPPPKPSYPSLEKDQKIFNKDLENDSNNARVPVAKVDLSHEKARNFRLGHFAIVKPKTGETSLADLPQQRSTRSSSSPDQALLEVWPHESRGKPEMLLVPQGWVAPSFETADGKVWVGRDGNTYFQSEGESLKIPLRRESESPTPLSPAELDLYTLPTDIQLNEWPESLQQAIQNLKNARERGIYSGSQGNVILAEHLASFMRVHFKYPLKGNSVKGAVEMAHSGAFQCDGAALILLSILRTEFGIPARLLMIMPGVTHPNDPGSTYVVYPAMGHMVVEVPNTSGKWHEVDSTPSVTTEPQKPKDDSQEKKDPYSQVQQNLKDPEPQKENENSEQGEAAKDELTKLIQQMEEAQKSKSKHDPEGKKDEQAPATSTENDPNKQEKNDGKASSDKKIDELPPSPLKLDAVSNPLQRKLIQTLLAWCIDPELTSRQKIDRLFALKSFLAPPYTDRFEGLLVLRAALNEAIQVFEGPNRPAFLLFLEQILVGASQRSLTETADDLALLQRQIEFTIKNIPNPEFYSLEEMRSEIASLRESFLVIRHPQSTAIRTAEEFFSQLPGSTSRQVIRSRYSLGDSFQDDSGTLALANDLNAKRLSDFRLMTVLAPHAHFITEQIPNPSYTTLRTWTPRKQMEPDGINSLLFTDDPSTPEYRQVNLYEDMMSSDEALRQGLLGTWNQFEDILVPEGNTDTEPEGVFIVLMDVSPSMRGTPSLFQAAYVGAMIDRAFTPLKRNGKPINKVYILPFDGKVHDPIPVTNPDSARAVVSQIYQTLVKTDGHDTNIQLALLSAADLIGKARLEGQKATTRATVVLCTDGESNVEARVVRQAFEKATAGEIQTQIAFVAINGENPDLAELARGGKLDVHQTLYRAWNLKEINRFFIQSQDVPNVASDFWTRTVWADLPDSILAQFEKSVNALKRIQSQFQTRNISKKTNPHPTLQQVESELSLKYLTRKEKREKSSHLELSNLREILQVFGKILRSNHRSDLLELLFLEWQMEIEIPSSDWDQYEFAHLTHLVNWSKGDPGI